MADRVFLVHGWSVTTTKTYQSLHLKLKEANFQLEEIFLGRYVSMDDKVEIKDIAAAMQLALIDRLGKPPWNQTFHIITHSTGALVTKDWVVNHYVGKYAARKALGNLIFLAGPHFGSRLAHHGRSMFAKFVKGGETGEQVLRALELGSQFSWDNNLAWLDEQNWKAKGIRPYCLIGDRVGNNVFGKKIFPAGYEKGSDGVVRVAAANLNFRRYRIDASRDKAELVGDLTGIPFVALRKYSHSGDKHGIMNSITTKADPNKDAYLNLKLIIDCLSVTGSPTYGAMRNRFKQIMAADTKRKKFTQLDFRFRDDTGAPIDDYVFTLGAVKNGKSLPSQTIAHTHKNDIDPSHFTVFIDRTKFEPDLSYFMTFDSKSGTGLFSYEPDPYHSVFTGPTLGDVIGADRTTQIEVILGRTPSRNLFRFHTGRELEDHHVKWNREGQLTGDDDID